MAGGNHTGNVILFPIANRAPRRVRRVQSNQPSTKVHQRPASPVPFVRDQALTTEEIILLRVFRTLGTDFRNSLSAVARGLLEADMPPRPRLTLVHARD